MAAEISSSTEMAISRMVMAAALLRAALAPMVLVIQLVCAR